MSQPEFLNPRSPLRPPPRWSMWRRAWILVIACLLTLGMGVLWFNLGRQSLASISLPDGAQLKVWAVTTGREHEFIVSRQFPPGQLIARYVIPWQNELSLLESDEEGVVIWLSQLDHWNRSPRELQGVERFVAVDEQGWTYPMTQIQRAEWVREDRRSTQSLAPVNGFRMLSSGELLAIHHPALPPLENDAYREIIYAIRLPELTGRTIELKAYGNAGQLLGSVRVPVRNNPYRNVSAVLPKLPQTQDQHGLAVTLRGLRLAPATTGVSGLRAVRVIPDLALSLNGGDAAGWDFGPGDRLMVTDDLGHFAPADLCTVSPWSAQWTLDLEIRRKPQSAVLPGLRVVTEPLPAPAPGELRESQLTQVAGSVRIHLLRMLGPGHHRFTITNPLLSGQLGHRQKSSISQQRLVWLSSTGEATVGFDALAPTAVFLLEGLNNELATFTVLAPDGRKLPTQHFATDCFSQQDLAKVPVPSPSSMLVLVWPEVTNGTGNLETSPESPTSGIAVNSISFEIIIDQPLVYRFVVQPPEMSSQK